MPRTHGLSTVPLASLHAWVEQDRPLFEHSATVETSVEAEIGEQVSRLIEDGATVQIGIGAIPAAVLSRLKNKHDLGVHTEMFSDGVVDLVQAGVITNRRKRIYPGQLVTSFVIGSRRLFDFVDENPQVVFLPCDMTNDTNLLRKIDRLVALNSALQIDLTGQVCADSIGHRIYSGIGGSDGFYARRSDVGGRAADHCTSFDSSRWSHLANCSRANVGRWRCDHAGHVHWVVTEYGSVNLHGLTLRQRGEQLISIAHPDFRSDLRKQFAAIRHYPSVAMSNPGS